jgi:predicted Zn-dependent peptidase
MKTPKIYKNSTGLNYLLYSSSDLVTATILVLVKTGTDYENKKNNGISHFIEHLFFKGTQNFPSPQELSLELDKIGAEYNAFTSYEYTGYYIKTLPEYLERAIYLMSDMLINPLFDQKELEKERKVIFEEINFHYDTPYSFIFDEALKLSYEDQPAGWSILGTQQSLKNINHEQIKNYFQNHYSTKNTLVVVVGNFNFQKIIKYLNKYFAKYNNKKSPLKHKFQETPFRPKLKIIKRENIKQTHLIMLFKTRGLSFLKEKRFSLGLLTSLLGYGFSSRMFKILREEMGITYYVKVNDDLYTDRGYLYIQTGSTIDKTPQTIEKIINEINLLKKQKIDEEEIQKSKALLESSLLSTAESSLSIGLFYGLEYLLQNKIHSPLYFLSNIKKITENDLKKEIYNYLNKQNLVSVVLSPQNFKKEQLIKIINNLN